MEQNTDQEIGPHISDQFLMKMPRKFNEERVVLFNNLWYINWIFMCQKKKKLRLLQLNTMNSPLGKYKVHSTIRR